jgi:23S rRNA pseudouridine1911/1915/1917 synthase
MLGQMRRELTVTRADRLDKTVAALFPELSRSAAQRLIDDARVTVNGEPRPARYLTAVGDVIAVDPPEPAPTQPQPEAIPLTILFEDEDLLAIDKPAGMVVHPGAGNNAGTVVNALLHLAPEAAETGDTDRPGIVHRLDKETSGVLLLARTARGLESLQTQFKQREIQKTYLAVCIGDVQPPRGVINKPVGRDPSNRQRMAVLTSGREAVTAFNVTESLKIDSRPYSVLRANPQTGRTHQIRVHLASIGFPIVGDLLYGANRDPLSKTIAPRHLLHAQELRFTRPATGEPVVVYAPLPEDFRALLAGEG